MTTKRTRSISTIYHDIRQLIRYQPLLINAIRRYKTDQDFIPRSALAIAAHPDDIEFFFAGTLAYWARHGTDIVLIVCTSGEAGTDDHSISIDELRSIRENEQLAAAKVLGVEKVIFLRNPDGLLENSIDLRRRMVKEIRLFRPEVVVIGDPTIYFGDFHVNHPDHRAAWSAGLVAVDPLSRAPLIFQELEAEGIQAHRVSKLYIHTYLNPNTWVDITQTIDIKISALKKHVSQVGDKDPSNEVREFAAWSARFSPAKYAEAYKVIHL